MQIEETIPLVEDKLENGQRNLFESKKSILQVHGGIQKEQVIISIDLDRRYNFINILWLRSYKFKQQKLRTYN